MKPRDYTQQEKIVAKCLDDLGLRYEQQAQFGNLSADFFLSELNLVIEADGVYGHLKKADRERDAKLLGFPGVQKVEHIKATTAKDIKREVENLIFSETYDCLG